MLESRFEGGRGMRPSGGRGGARGGGRVRLIQRGELRLLLLKLLQDGPRHGYELIKAMEELSGGAYVPSPGMIYPGLTMLEELGEITASQDSGRRQFSLTDQGLIELVRCQDQVAALFTRIEHFAQIRSATESGPVRRAMENLRQVLWERMSQGELSRESQLQIAELIDDAARKIERL